MSLTKGYAEEELVSVVIPVYNNRSPLLRTINSVLRQTYKNIEVLVIDDGSEENIKLIVNSFNDQKLHYYKLQHQNANVARNEGINKSKGEFIAMLDADDLWLETHLQDSLETLKKTGSDGVYGSIYIRKKDQSKIFYARELKKKESMVTYLLRTGYGAQTSSLFLTADSIKKVMWNPQLKRHQDYDFVVRYSKTYKLKPKLNPTAIHTIKGGKKEIDFESCISFIQANNEDIDHLTYTQYHIAMYALSLNYTVTQEIHNYYKGESVRYPQYVPYYKYKQIKNPHNRLDSIRLKIKYLYGIIKS